MSFFKLLKNSLLFYFRTQHLPVILGTVIGTGILIGALIVGDSVRFSLEKMTLDRLGKTKFAISSGDRYFRVELAKEIAKDLQVKSASVLNLNGIAVAGGGQSRLNNVQILGIENNFWDLSPENVPVQQIKDNQAVINNRLALKMGLKVNDNLLLRINSVDFFPLDAPFARDIQKSVALRVTIKAIIQDKHFGRFSLKTNQIPPYNVFLSASFLSETMDMDNRANILLVADNKDKSLTINMLEQFLDHSFKLADAGLKFTELPEFKTFELTSDRIFLEPAVVAAVDETGLEFKKILTYFVNQFKVDGKTTPYSFISAPGEPIVHKNLKEDQIIINQWLADDLSAKTGDTIRIDYYVPGPARQLLEKSTSLKIAAIVPIMGRTADKHLMPGFPGLADADNCRDWDPGIPIDLDKIRQKDEKYWDTYRGTPKAYISLLTAQNLWENRFGKLTAIRFPVSSINPESIQSAILNNLKPASVGLVFRPVLEEGLIATKEAVDFGQLFLGLSFFIIVSALILTGLLYILGIEKRANETGLLLAVGYKTGQVKKLYLGEIFIIAVVGSLLGIMFGILYNQIVLFGLGSLWRGAVGTSSLTLHIVPVTLLIGFAAGIFIIFIAIGLVIQRQSLKSIVDLQQAQSRYHDSLSRKKINIAILTTLISLVGVFIILITTDPGRGHEASAVFFGAGSLLLIAGLCSSYLILIRVSRKTDVSSLNLSGLGVRNNSRNRKRSLAIIGLLACGIFIVIGVGANRQGSLLHAEKRESGTGGFAFWGETVSPVLYDLNSQKGRKFFELDTEEFENADFVQMRRKSGDDASCLNLNRVRQPAILGLDPAELDKRGAFTFSKTIGNIDKSHIWLELNKKYADNVIPAIADETVIIWGLGKAVGDTLNYINENGQPLKLVLIAGLVNSIFQGHVLIAENLFIDQFPSAGGYNVFLADVPKENQQIFEKHLTFIMQNFGLELIPSYVRLAEFNKVENTYLSIFLSLGGLGLILGSIGLGIIVFRNILERRGEMALLSAVGFSRQSIMRLLLSEHIFLLIAGLLTGTVSALISILPVFFTPGISVPYFSIVLAVLFLFIFGFLWIYIAARSSLKTNLIPALRYE
ncbi:ABC transporter permease [candidate division KSB1 bacterium]|nr:ABC transporter permease [candidate division KSB1 bacterium]